MRSTPLRRKGKKIHNPTCGLGRGLAGRGGHVFLGKSKRHLINGEMKLEDYHNEVM